MQKPKSIAQHKRQGEQISLMRTQAGIRKEGKERGDKNDGDMESD